MKRNTLIGLSAVFIATLGQSACSTEEATSPILHGAKLPDLVFVKHASEGSDLYGLNLAEMSVTQLTESAAMDEFPTWSRDGTRIAYLSLQGDQISTHVLNMSSGQIRELLHGLAEPVSWSGDSKSVVVTKEYGDTRGLAAVPVGEGEEFRVATGADGDAYATWSPTADRIAFESTRDGNPEIYAAGLDGSNVLRLTDNDVLDEWPQWSSSGKHIAYASGVEGDKDLWVMQSDGNNKRQLTDELLFGDAYPSWSPDDRQIVITVQESESSVALVMVDVNSGATRRLVDGAAASWRPAEQEETGQ